MTLTSFSVIESPIANRRPGILRSWLRVLHSPVGAISFALLTLVGMLAILGPIIWGSKALAIDTTAIYEPASGDHWLGTDGLGRDLFARTMVATRLSVQLALLATMVGVISGIILGALPWLLPPWLGRCVTAMINIAVAFPGLLLALFFAVVIGAGAVGAVLAIGLAMAPWFARVTQALVAGIKEREFIAAARVSRSSRLSIFFRHILPNIGESLIVNAMSAAGGAMVAFAGLSYLGLGVQAPDYDLGILLNEGFLSIYVNAPAALGPAAIIVLAGIAFNLTGEMLAMKIGLRNETVVAPSRPRATTEATVMAGDPVLEVRDLVVEIADAGGATNRPVRGVSFSIGRGESVGVVGESGSGKSLTALAIAGLLEVPTMVAAERVQFLGTDIRDASRDQLVRHTLGTSFGMVFQDPATSLNPTIRIGRQLAEVTQVHGVLGRRASFERAVERLRSVRVPAADRRARQYPHEFSGGMRQRAMIAMSIMGDPALIVADEPTTALDVTVERQVLAVLQKVRADGNAAILLISHDITVVSRMCDRILVMYAGRIVEDLPNSELRSAARHPYTRALLAAMPDMQVDRSKPLATISGQPVDCTNPPPGCSFAPRCPLVVNRCRTDRPPLEEDAAGRRVACWRADEPVPADPESDQLVGPAL